MTDKTIALSKEAIRKKELAEQKAEITERVTLVKHSLFSAFYQNRWPVVDLNQIINRLCMLLQERCVIVLLERKENIGYTILHHTCLDPFWKGDFENYIKNTLYKEVISQKHPSEDLIILDKDRAESFEIEINEKKRYINIKEYLIKFHEDKYFMIHKMYSPRDTKPTAKGKRTFLPISIKSNEYLYYLSKTLSCDKNNPVDPVIDKIFSDKKLNERISRKAKNWKKQKIKREVAPPSLLNLYWKYTTNDSKKSFEDNFKEIRKIFNQEYLNIRESPLLTSNSKTPNIIFFIREFTQKELRFRRKPGEERYYPYRIRILIPDAQKDDLRKGFEELKEKRTNIIDFHKYLTVKNVRDDGFFWKLLEKPGGIDKILEIIEKPNQLCARSMSDASFESGYVNIKEGPFTFGGTSRLEKEELEKYGKSEGYQRSICIHYAFTIMSPRADANKNFQILTVPGSVGGSPLFCAGFVYPLIKDDDKPKYPREYHRMWLNNYHFYHAICHYLIFNVRTKITRLYLDKVRYIYENSQDDILNKIVHGISFNKKDICDLLNPQFHILCRIFPFELIKLHETLSDQSSVDKEKLTSFDIYYAGGNFPLAVYVHKNPFFLNQITSSSILEENQIEECINTANDCLKQRLIERIKEHNL